MAKKSKQRSKPKFSLKKSLPWVFGVLAVVAVAVVVILVINLKKPSSTPDIAAYVNNEIITMKELDYSYQYVLPSEYKDILSKWQFLNESVIPQKLLLQEALKNDVTVTDEEVKVAIDELIQFSGLTREEFERQLEGLDLEWSDVELTYWTRLTISHFVNEFILGSINVSTIEVRRAYNTAKLEEENISFEEATPYIQEELLMEKESAALLEYLNRVRQNSTIIILLDEAQQGIVSFIQSGEVCATNGKIPIHMFTVSTCKECLTVASRLATILRSYETGDGSPFIPYLWELDTGDNLYTPEIENGVLKEHLTVFKDVSSQGMVPAYSFGCAYTRLGHLPGSVINVNAEEEEFNAVLSALLVQHE